MSRNQQRTARLAMLTVAVTLAMWLALAVSHPVNAQEEGAEINVSSVAALPWTAEGPNTEQVQGVITLDGQPVEGVQVAVGGYQISAPTDAQGQFTYPVDRTLVRRLPVEVTDASNATVNGNTLSEEQQAALGQAEGGINVHYEVVDVAMNTQEDGTIVVSGTVQFANDQPPPPVVLYSYRLTGTVTNSMNEPVEGAIVSTRTPEFRWTLSEPTGPQGHYTSIYWPTESEPFNVLLIEGSQSFPVEGNRNIQFPLYQSASMDVTLDRDSGTITTTEPITIDGFIYDGLLVGVTQDGAPVRPISATWPNEQGRFQMVLPAELEGHTVQWWQESGRYFSTIPAEPGGEISLDEWPTELEPAMPHGFETIDLPS